MTASSPRSAPTRISTDEKPKHGSSDTARAIAFQTIASRVEGTEMTSEELGVA